MITKIKQRLNLLKNIFILALIYLACSDEKNQDSEDPILNTSFSFLQDVNKLYFSVTVGSVYQGNALDGVVVLWYGVNLGSQTDTISLNDFGTNGDIIMNDNIFSRKISNNSPNLKNDLTDVTGRVYMEYIATFGSEHVTLRDSVLIGNIIPRIESVIADTVIQRPSDATVSLHLIKAQVFDADGLNNIKWVGFTSYHVEGDSMMNSGSPIYLHDDGSEIILYEPNITSGDSAKGDGLYSFRIPVYGTGFEDPNFQTKTGTFKWRFKAQDKANDYSNMVEHEIVIQ
jgi:hypothetical protein|tara:strand:+ start:556 stop:1413 length:858 start_codon:yes stop_codon:yes gene_type:complete